MYLTNLLGRPRMARIAPNDQPSMSQQPRYWMVVEILRLLINRRKGHGAGACERI
jgi:hypothetical protein